MAIPLSIVVPVYNRPGELRELLQSISQQEYQDPLEVVVVEDGSELTAEEVVGSFSDKLEITYLKKPNTGPGASRNDGMERAKFDYFVILDSDCILAANYLREVQLELQKEFVHCFGGPDAADASFTEIQKAINFSMTSFITTGGIRGSKKAVSTFEPRSFNMGLSQEAFVASGGFGRIHPGEDPDLVWRLRKLGYTTRLFPKAVVYHKRRIDFKKFYTQVHKFGKARPILSRWHPESKRLTHWLPTVFLLGMVLIPILYILGFHTTATGIAIAYGVYAILVVAGGVYRDVALGIGFLALVATLIQFYGYGWGFLKSVILLTFSSAEPEQLFPELFFK